MLPPSSADLEPGNTARPAPSAIRARVTKEAPHKDLLDINILEVIVMSHDVLQRNHVILRTGRSSGLLPAPVQQVATGPK
jgi:hypothetical protein